MEPDRVTPTDNISADEKRAHDLEKIFMAPNTYDGFALRQLQWYRTWWGMCERGWRVETQAPTMHGKSHTMSAFLASFLWIKVDVRVLVLAISRRSCQRLGQRLEDRFKQLTKASPRWKVQMGESYECITLTNSSGSNTLHIYPAAVSLCRLNMQTPDLLILDDPNLFPPVVLQNLVRPIIACIKTKPVLALVRTENQGVGGYDNGWKDARVAGKFSVLKTATTTTVPNPRNTFVCFVAAKDGLDL